MNEIEKLYQNAKIKKQYCGWLDMGDLDCQMQYVTCNSINEWKNAVFSSRFGETEEEPELKYPEFTAEKQLEIENVILQNKKAYNRWIEYNINAYGEMVIRFVRTDKFAPYVAVEKTRAEALSNLTNNLWQDLTEEERKQIKEILK